MLVCARKQMFSKILIGVGPKLCSGHQAANKTDMW